MKQTVSLIGLALSLALFTGCTTFQGNAGKTLSSVCQTVDAAMKGWASFVVLGGATQQQQDAVKAAYEKYQLVEATAEKAYVTLAKTGDKTGWEQASSALTAVQSDLMLLITTFNPSKKGTL